MSMLPEYETKTMTIGDFFKFDDYWWTNKTELTPIWWRSFPERFVGRKGEAC